MPFRSDDHPSIATPVDPLARFAEIHAALASERKWYTDHVPLRLAAVCLITTPGDPELLAAATHEQDAALRAQLGWLNTIDPAVRMLIAAQMVKHGDEPEAFLAEVERARTMFRALGLRRGGVYEVLAVLVLRRVLGRTPIDMSHISRFQGIYEAMKQHHWWLTGPEDFPACAMLLARPEDPATIGAGTDAVYRALHERAHLWRGDSLQTAANVLYLAGAGPEELADRFALLLAGFRDGAGQHIGAGQYDELAILCFLAWPIERVLETVLGYRDQLRATQSWIGKAGALNIASSLAFVRIAGADGALGPLADAKLLLDMQAITAARHAATAATAV
jgi:hypothetical protein